MTGDAPLQQWEGRAGTERVGVPSPLDGVVIAMYGEFDPAEDAAASHDKEHGGIGVAGAPMGSVDGQPMVPSSDQQTRAVVDANHDGDDRAALRPASERLSDGVVLDMVPESMLDSAAFADQEMAAAREWEKDKTRKRSPNDDRAERTREAVTAMDINGFDNPPESTAGSRPSVPLGGLSADTQEEAAREATRMYDTLDTQYSAVGIQRVLGERLRAGEDMTWAVLNTAEEVQVPPGTTPIAQLREAQPVTRDLDGRFVAVWRPTIQGEVVDLWEPRQGTGIKQVGLIEDHSGQTKFTIWESASERGLTSTYSEPGQSRWHEPAVTGRLQEGDTVVLHNVLRKVDHKGRPCVEVDRKSEVEMVSRAPRNENGTYTPQRLGRSGQADNSDTDPYRPGTDTEGTLDTSLEAQVEDLTDSLD